MFDWMNIEFARLLIFFSVILSEETLRRCSHKKGVLKIYSIFTREHPCQSMISIKLQTNSIEITLRYGCSTVNLLHIFRTPFPRNTYGGLLVIFESDPVDTGRKLNVHKTFRRLFGGDSANFLLCFVKCERQKSIFFLPIRKDNSILLRVVDLFKFLKQVPLPTLAVVFFVVLKLSLSLNLVKNCFQVN